MAEQEEKKEAQEPQDGEQPTNPKKKKGLFLGGGIVGLVAAAYALSLAALPSAQKDMPFEGPFAVELTTAGEVQVNLKGDGAKRYMVMTLQAEYDAYDQAYAGQRVSDPLYQAKLRDVLIGLGRQKTKDDLDDQVGLETFKVQLRDAVDPLVFPLHIGNAEDHRRAHEASGLLPGRSADLTTMRGGFRGHVLHVDANKQTIALDEGSLTQFDGTEVDLLVESERGQVVYVDVSGLTPDFVGDVPVGTFGRVRSILFGKFLVQ